MRLVADCRRPNQWFGPVPATRLFSSSGMADIDATEEGHMWYSGFDVTNAFFQHSMPQWLRPDFCLPAVSAGDLNLTEVDGDRLAPSDLVFPQMAVIPMRWSWGLNFVQRAHKGILNQSQLMAGAVRARDFEPVPSLTAGPIHSMYVDNLIVHGELQAGCGNCDCPREKRLRESRGAAS